MDPVVQRIMDAAKQKGLDQKTLAFEIGVRPQAITEWKKGVTSSYTKYLPQIAETLGVSVEYLLNGGQKEKPETQPGSGLSEGEQLLISLFRMLSQEDKDAVLRIVQAAANGKRSPE